MGSNDFSWNGAVLLLQSFPLDDLLQNGTFKPEFGKFKPNYVCFGPHASVEICRFGPILLASLAVVSASIREKSASMTCPKELRNLRSHASTKDLRRAAEKNEPWSNPTKTYHNKTYFKISQLTFHLLVCPGFCPDQSYNWAAWWHSMGNGSCFKEWKINSARTNRTNMQKIVRLCCPCNFLYLKQDITCRSPAQAALQTLTKRNGALSWFAVNRVFSAASLTSWAPDALKVRVAKSLLVSCWLPGCHAHLFSTCCSFLLSCGNLWRANCSMLLWFSVYTSQSRIYAFTCRCRATF